MSRSRSSSYSSRSRSRSPRGYREEEESNTTIFAGNLNHETNEDDLRRFFSTYGKVVETTIIYDQETGRPRGFGFVKFDDQRDAEDAAAEATNKILDGRPLKCNLARTGGRGGFHSRGSFRGGRGPGRFGDRAGGPYRRRPRSPSPGRYLPERYSPERSLSPSRKRQRFSPLGYDRENTNARSGATRPQVPRQARSPSASSSYTSGSSYTTSDSEARAKRPRDPPTITVIPEPANAKKELQEAKQREDEASIRAAALQAEVEQSRTIKQEMQVLLEDTSHRLQRSELTCKQYRKWLQALVNYSQAVVTGKEKVKTAEAAFAQREEELGLFLKECHDFLSQQKKPRRKHSERQAAGTIVAEDAKVAQEEQPTQLEADTSTPDGGVPNGMTAAKFKPGIKFKLAS